MNKLLPKDTFYIDIADWEEDVNILKMIRTAVFINEQNVPIELEWDGLDESCIHFIVRSNNDAIATARLTPEGQIGRMAVLSGYRGLGIGTALLLKIINHAKNTGFNKLYLHAQTQAAGFYEKHDFKTEGDEFMDAGIRHRAMYKHLA
jgi:predicted GNAT family N-acyltransferase